MKKNGKCFIKLEDSIFYPQGGGQKGDRGYLVIDGVRHDIANSVKDEKYNSILVMSQNIDDGYIGADVECYLDWDFRYKQMRLHTSFHIYHVLIEEAIGRKLDNPFLSTIEDGYAVNKYNELAFDVSVVDEVIKKFKELINTDVGVATYPDKENPDYRYWECMNHIIPCGGVHVDNLNEIGDTEVEVSHKKKAVTVKIILK